MDIEKIEITIEDLCKDYEDNDENGVVAFGGKLDVRPPFQREFVYKDKQRDLVIETIINGFPLNTMYWNVKNDGTFEILDGQQRTISICQYVTEEFSFKKKMFSRQSDNIQRKILDYKLHIYKCIGDDDDEKLEWFQIINIAGVKLTHQELLNAIYPGPWTTNAKKNFSKRNCHAYAIGKDFMPGSPIRQDYLAAVLRWISDNDAEEYMNKHCQDENADELWNYYEGLVDWVKSTFISEKSDIRKKQMKKVPWGTLYNKFNNDPKLNPEKIRAEVTRLFKDKEVKNKSGIYSYVLDGKEHHLSVRVFDENDKETAYANQNGICAICEEEFDIGKMEGDHIIPWSDGGKTDLDNCQMLCKECNRRKSNN